MTHRTTSDPTTPDTSSAGPSRAVLLVASWVILVILPLLYGLVELISKLGALGS